MINAKKEFLEHIENRPRVVCAVVKDVHYDNENKRHRVLYENYTEVEYNSFLESLDFVYDDGYGFEYLGGTIWYKDGTYSDRGKYDGSEWWEYHKAPKKPKKVALEVENE